MARQTDIRIRRSAVAGAIPLPANLNLGELALNTVDGKMYMKTSVGGTDAVVEIGGGGVSFEMFEYTATSNQTTFSGSDSNSNTLAYDVPAGTNLPRVQVFLNGILLDYTTDFTATNGSSVVLTVGASTGDNLQVAAYKTDVSLIINQHLVDNQKLVLGTGSDLEIYHSGTHSYIKDTGTGNLNILASSSINLLNGDSSDYMARFNDNGSNQFFYDGDNKLATTSTGIQVTGNISASGNITAVTGEFAGTLRVTETGTAQNFLMGNQDSGGTNKPARIQGVNGYLRFGHGSSWSGEGGTFTEKLVVGDNTNIASGALQIGGTTVIDSGRNFTAAQSVKVNAIASSNSSPAADDVELSGYGLIGNRPNLYITNANATGQIVLGISGAHNANAKLTVTTSGVTVAGTVTATGNIVVNKVSPKLSAVATDAGQASVDLSNTALAARWILDSDDLLRVYNQTSAFDAFAVKSSGKVGVGTASPESLLHVKAASGVTGVIKIEGGKNTVTSAGEINAQLDFGSNDTSVNGTGNVGGRIASITRNTNGALVDMAFSTFYQSQSPDLAEHMRIRYDGNVGIGTNDPDAKLRIDQNVGTVGLKVTGGSGGIDIAQFTRDVGGTGTVGINASGSDPQMYFTSAGNTFALGVNSNTFEISDNSHIGTNTRFSITNAGNVGIGTTSPTAKLQISHNGGHTSGNVALANSSLDLYNPLAANTDEKGSILTFSDNYFGGGSLYPRTTRAAIKGGTDTVGNTADGFLAFYTDAGGANSMPERMRITKDGYVGIGTTSPIGALDVSGTTNAHTTVAMGPSTAATDKEIYLDLYRSNSSSVRQKIGVLRSGIPIAGIRGAELWSYQTLGLETANTGSGHIVFKPKGTEMMRIDATGNVGIGNTAPSSKLHVA